MRKLIKYINLYSMFLQAMKIIMIFVKMYSVPKSVPLDFGLKKTFAL